MEHLAILSEQVRGCDASRDVLPAGPRAVFQLSASATILIADQAPGTKVHASGIPFDDQSGDRLRAWMDISKEEFYDASRIAILPMGLCYPGRSGQGWRRPAASRMRAAMV